MITPLRILFFFALVFLMAGSLMLLVPEGGWQWRGYSIKFPTWQSFWDGQLRGQDVAMDEFFDIYGRKEDQSALRDSLIAEEKAFRQRMKYFQFPNDDVNILAPFFKDLAVRCQKGRVRILHFGDSQIEGHRISGYLNRQFQQRYGGSGPGWLPVIKIIPTPAVQQTSSDSWHRFTVFGTSRSTTHNRYGLLGSFARFTPQIDNTLESTSDSLLLPITENDSPTELAQKAWFSIGPSKLGGRHEKHFTQARLAFGNFIDTLHYQIWFEDHMASSGKWVPTSELVSQTWTLPQPVPKEIRFVFEGKDSPDFYGISLEKEHGIYVDNIPLRGSSGTEFAKMDLRLMPQQSDGDDVAMIILQFGGNVMPNIKDSIEVAQYGRYFAAQIKYLKRQFPASVFLVIGPSDMSIKEDLTFSTYPVLPLVRDAMKRVSFEEGALYYDLYEAMGGLNSMPIWVASEPPLATTDYIHFTNAGASKVAEWLMEAFNEAEQRIQIQGR